MLLYGMVIDVENKITNILGTEYKIYSDLKNKNSDGECGLYNKEIHIRPIEDMLDGEPSSFEEKELRYKQVLRHELFHELFEESGISEWAYDEKLVDFLAIQFPKIFKVFQELNIL